MYLVQSLIFLVFGLTGVTRWIIRHFPVSIRSGILLGAGFASLMRVFNPAQPFIGKMPFALSVAALGSFIILFSSRTLRFREKSNLFACAAGFGIAPEFIIVSAALQSTVDRQASPGV